MRPGTARGIAFGLGLGLPLAGLLSPLMPLAGPAALGVLAGGAALAGAALGGASASRRRLEAWVAPVWEEGLMMGVDEQGQPFIWRNEEQVHHALLVGQSGSGKSVQLKNLMFQQVLRGGAAVFVDAKPSQEMLDEVAWLAKVTGREDDFRVLLPGDPARSHTWNPLQWGDVEQLTNLLASLRQLKGDAAVQYYRDAQDDMMAAVIGSLKVMGRPFHLGDVLAGICSESAREKLLKVGKHKGYGELGAAMAPYRDGQALMNTMQGVVTLLRKYTRAASGEIVLQARGEVDLRTVLRKRGILYVALPTQTAQKSAYGWGLLVSNALMAVAGEMIADGQKPEIPVLVVLDELKEYLSEGIGAAYTQWRAAGIAVVAALQTVSQLRKGRNQDEIDKQILGNSGCKEFFRQEGWDDAEAAAEQVGKAIKLMGSFALGEVNGSSSQGLGLLASRSRNRQERRTVSEKEEYEVRPEHLRGLPTGVLYHRFAGGHVKLRAPLVRLPEKPVRFEKRSYPVRASEPAGLWRAHKNEVMRALGRFEA